MNDSVAIRTSGVGKRYGSRWALRDCTLEIPAGSVTALVGPNGAGKTTLLHMVIGLVEPTSGVVEVLGHSPRRDAKAVLPRLGFVAQDHPLHRNLTVADTLRYGRKLNSSWNQQLAASRVERLGLSTKQKISQLSGGQQAQVALTLALAKQPRLLRLDEPVASLDPLARREFLNAVMEAVVDEGITVVLSSHIVAELERVCDHLVTLAQGATQLNGSISEIVASHRLLTGPRSDAASVARVHDVIRESHTDQTHLPGLGTHRGVPDVAATASPTPHWRWSPAPATASPPSKATAAPASAPLWAALIALADQHAGRHLGFVNAALYRVGRSARYHQASTM